MVDEFQDVSPLQSRLLDLWLGGRDQVCVVGDPAQTIYSFAGASAATCSSSLDATRARLVTLHRNYRSTPEVVAAANGVMRTASPSISAGSRSSTSSAPAAVTLRAVRESGAEVTFNGCTLYPPDYINPVDDKPKAGCATAPVSEHGSTGNYVCVLSLAMLAASVARSRRRRLGEPS